MIKSIFNKTTLVAVALVGFSSLSVFANHEAHRGDVSSERQSPRRSHPSKPACKISTSQGDPYKIVNIINTEDNEVLFSVDVHRTSPSAGMAAFLADYYKHLPCRFQKKFFCYLKEESDDNLYFYFGGNRVNYYNVYGTARAVNTSVAQQTLEELRNLGICY